MEAAKRVKKAEAELIIICGDITNFGSAKQAQALLSPIIESNVQVLYVPGNCDLPSLLENKIEGARSLHESCEKIDDLGFIGFGGAQSGPLNTPLEFPDLEISAILARGLSKCLYPERLVLVSHIPPFKTKVDLAFNGEHIGSQSVRRFVEDKKPLAVFCGHVHEARGSDNLKDTVILNPGPARHGYYAVADINDKVEVRLESFR